MPSQYKVTQKNVQNYPNSIQAEVRVETTIINTILVNKHDERAIEEDKVLALQYIFNLTGVEAYSGHLDEINYINHYISQLY